MQLKAESSREGCGTWHLVLFGPFLTLRILFEHGGHQPLRQAKRSLAQATEHIRQVYPAAGGGSIQNAEGADNLQVVPTCCCHAVALVHKKKASLLFLREGNGIAFAVIEVHEGGIGRRPKRHNAQPVARLCRPGADLDRGVGIGKLRKDGWRDEDASVEPGKYFDGFN